MQLPGVAGTKLRSKALLVAQSMLAFIKHRVWDEVDQLPCTLCSGNIEDNIAQLKDGNDAKYPTSVKIQKLV